VRQSHLRQLAFPLFAWGVVLHSLAIAFLFGAVRLDPATVRALAAWKEALLLALVVAVAVRAATRHGPGSALTGSDLAVGGLMAVAVGYFLAVNPIFGAALPASAQTLGVRDAVFFMLAYFVGRSAPALVADDVVMRRIFLLLVVVCVVAILERIFVTPEMLVALGIAAYFQQFLGVSEFTAGNIYGLPMNYWTYIGGVPVRRVGSVFLSGQGFAIPFLLFFPFALSWVFHRDRTSWAKVIALVVITVALLLTLTRMTIAVVLVQTLLFVAVRRRPEWAVFGVGVGATLFVVALLLLPGFAAFVWHTLSWQDPSAQSHAGEWARGITAFAERPWGWGLGTADQTAIRAGLNPITGDNLYLKYAVELGFLGFALLLAVFGTLAAAGYRLFRRGQEIVHQRLGLVVLIATIGIALNAFTAAVFNSVPLSWLYFWMAGAAATLAQRVERTEARGGT
jgi:O-antigen ligase